METVIDLESVSKIYPNVRALDEVTLQVAQGEAVAVVGPSGSGKSTLLNLLAGIDRPSCGRVRFAGIELNRLSEGGLARHRRRSVGLVFQFFNLLDELSALDNVVIAAELAGVPTKEARRRAIELLELLGLNGRQRHHTGSLSGGECQRVAMARALVNHPAVLLADEPTGALDSRTGDRVMDLLTDFHRAGQTTLLVTHDVALAARFADRTIRLADGRIVADQQAQTTA